jgi:SagB-type dehydrogenase family enzyme
MDEKLDFINLNSQEYQEITCYDRLNMPRHALDWSNVPRQTKSYPVLPKIALEPKVDLTGRSFWQVMEDAGGAAPNATLNISSLSVVLGLAYGYTARQRAGGQEYLYRSVPSAGALYPVEIYVSGEGNPGLPPGLFHYDIKEFSLQQLRGEEALALISGILGISNPEKGWVSFVLSGIFFRSAWKYQKRAFRYVMLDMGHLIENLVTALNFAGLSCSVRYDFVDQDLCSLLGLDRRKEACFAIVDVLPGDNRHDIEETPAILESHELVEDVVNASRVSPRERSYDAIEGIYHTSCQDRKGDDPGGPVSVFTLPEPREWSPVRQPADGESHGADYAGVVQRRRSRRNFIKEPVADDSFMQLLSLVGSTPGSDHGGETGLPFVTTGFLVGRVQGFHQGFYRLAHEGRTFGLLKSGSFVEKMAGVCLDQLWLANAGALFVFMTNLKALDDAYGARGYRYAMMAAGMLGQRLYLGSTALELGCCGIGAYYDHEARELLSLTEDSYLLYLVAVGRVKK